MPGRAARGLAVALAALGATAAHAEVRVPPGFTATVYVTDAGPDGGPAGIPSVASLAVDGDGALYVTRTGRRYVGGEVEELWPLLRFPPGGARLGRDELARHHYGPPLFSAHLGAVRDGRELLVTTFDRDRGVGALYRVVDGRAELLAGGTPEPGGAPLLKQPEGVAVDPAGNMYVADRQRGAVVKLDAAGRVLDARWLAVTRPRLVAADGPRLWVAADGESEAPWQRGTGELWSVDADGPRLVLRTPLVAGMAVSPTGRLVLADRHGARLFAVAADGRTTEVASFTDGDAPRVLAWAPSTEATRRAGIAGDLFVAVIRRGAWMANEIVRISGFRRED